LPLTSLVDLAFTPLDDGAEYPPPPTLTDVDLRDPRAEATKEVAGCEVAEEEIAALLLLRLALPSFSVFFGAASSSSSE
jgi:hypothetical protein